MGACTYPAHSHAMGDSQDLTPGEGTTQTPSGVETPSSKRDDATVTRPEGFGFLKRAGAYGQGRKRSSTNKERRIKAILLRRPKKEALGAIPRACKRRDSIVRRKSHHLIAPKSHHPRMRRISLHQRSHGPERALPGLLRCLGAVW